MPVIRTLEQLRNRRHAFLALPPDPIHERKIQRVDPAQEVGWLAVEMKGKKKSLVVTLGQDFWIGRHPDCDMVLKEPSISNFHLRIYAVRTSCQQSLICIHDLSTNGFLVNGLEYKSGSFVEVGGTFHSPRTVILRPDDRVTFPHSSAGCTVHYYSRHSQPTQNTLAAGQVRCHIQPLFPSSDPTLSRTLKKTWIIQNFTLGTGSFGRVHLAKHATQPLLQAACKTVGKLAEVEKEVQIMSSITHPNVCGIYDMIEDERTEYLVHLVMPLVTGGDLFSYMEKHQRLTEDEAKFAGLQIIRGVEHLHARGIAHRDIKPENILLHKAGAFPRLLLADFGLATTHQRVLAEVPSDRTRPLTRHPGFIGTVTYLPPERLKLVLSRKRSMGGSGESVHGGVVKWREEMGRKFFDEEKQLDVWAVGAVLYLILTGVHPYDNRNDPNASDDDDTIQTFSQSQPKQDKSYRKLSSARSWDAFRSSNRLGTVGDGTVTEQELEWRRVEERCSKFLKLGLNHWRPAERWTEISAEGIQLIAGLLNQHPIKRISMPQALIHRWFTEQQEDLDAMYKTVVIDGKLGRSPIWRFNNGVPPRRREPSPTPPPAKIPQPIKPTEVSPSKRSKQSPKKKSTLKPKEALTTSFDTPKARTGTSSKKTPASKSSKNNMAPSSSTTLTDIPKSRSKGKKPSAVPPTIPSPSPVIAKRRPSSLFLPNSGIFGPLDDIAEADEDVDMPDAEAEADARTDAALTLHDLMYSPGKKQREGSDSGGSEKTRVELDGDVNMDMESHPPVQAGKRKVQVGKAGKGKSKVMLETQDIQQDDELRPSDLVNTLNVDLPELTLASSSKIPTTGIKPPIRKSSFVPPVKKAKPGVVLARVEKGK